MPKKQGVVLYQDGERLEPDDALARTGDAELVRAYERRVSSSTGSAVGDELSRDGSLPLALGGLGLVTVAGVQVASDENLAEKGLGDFALRWVGTGLALASIVPALIARQTHEGAVEHSLDTRLVPPHLADRTFDEVRRITVHVPAAAVLALGALPKMRALRDAMVAELENPPLEALVDTKQVAAIRRGSGRRSA